MTYKKSILFAAVFAVTGVTAVGSSTLARGMEGGRTGMAEAQKQKVEERKTAIKERIETAKTERATKLADKRLEQCEKREARVNTIFTKATERNTKQLAVFQKIEERVKAFYVSKNITAEGYEAAAQNADDKEAVAVAAIEASTETTFDCATADGAKPGSAIKEAMTARHTALKDYRTAIKDLILVVKKHNGQNRDRSGDTTDETDATSDTEATTETESETEGQQ
jgi:predicted nucleic acid-binding protein